MIEGIKIEMTTEELKRHIEGRAKFHADKAEWYAKRVSDIRAGGVTDNPGVSNDPSRTLAEGQRKHDEKAAFFAILATHLIPNEQYRLEDEDLRRLEFYSHYF